MNQDMTIEELAKATGLSDVTISNIERSKTNAALPNLRKLSKALQAPIHYLGCFESLPEITLSERIRKARLYHGLTKQEMADMIG